MIFRNLLIVGFGGAIGSITRYLVALFLKNNSFPYSTLVVNIVGSFLIGMAMAFVAKQQEQHIWRLLLATGFCGGFTTFSALSWEILEMLQQQRFSTALIYIATSLLIGLVAVYLGYLLLK